MKYSEWIFEANETVLQSCEAHLKVIEARLFEAKSEVSQGHYMEISYKLAFERMILREMEVEFITELINNLKK